MIVLEWAEIVQSFQQPTTHAMDSYYLDNNCRQRLLERGVRDMAALKSDRFASIAQLLRPGVRQQETPPPGLGMVSEEKLRSIIGPGKRELGRILPFPIASR